MSGFNQLTYLIVDDVCTVREFLKQSLFQMGVTEIHEAPDGQTALSRFSEHLPDVVFLDIELPDLDGNEILRKIKARKSDAFVVMISAHSSVDNVKSAVSNGASGFIVKPFSPQKITNILNKYPR